MSQWIRVLAALAGDLWFLRPEPHKGLQLNTTLVLGDLESFSDFCRYKTHTWCAYIHTDIRIMETDTEIT